jgi:hypothetical protein
VGGSSDQKSTELVPSAEITQIKYLMYQIFWRKIFFSYPHKDTRPEIYLHRGLRPVILTLKPNVNRQCSVDQLAHILNLEKAETVIIIELENEFNDLCASLQHSVVKNRVRWYYAGSSMFRLTLFRLTMFCLTKFCLTMFGLKAFLSKCPFIYVTMFCQTVFCLKTFRLG